MNNKDLCSMAFHLWSLRVEGTTAEGLLRKVMKKYTFHRDSSVWNSPKDSVSKETLWLWQGPKLLRSLSLKVSMYFQKPHQVLGWVGSQARTDASALAASCSRYCPPLSRLRCIWSLWVLITLKFY